MLFSRAVFNARALYAWKADVLYRVYVRPDALHFVKVEGQGIESAWATFFGAAIAATISRKAREKREARIAESDTADPEALVAADRNNFTARVEDVRRTTIGRKAWFPSHGRHVARWTLELADGRNVALQFEDEADVRAAVGELRAVLGETLSVTFSATGADATTSGPAPSS